MNEDQKAYLKAAARFGQTLEEAVAFLIAKANEHPLGSDARRPYVCTYEELMWWAEECDALRLEKKKLQWRPVALRRAWQFGDATN